ncbi:MAG: serine hydrolase [Oscillospiraceae bacterium]|jgi:CubicO group peptidase (beta-lactamase class C family)|nr:serine hydrolase [Oscillospiraceae bacterium]
MPNGSLTGFKEKCQVNLDKLHQAGMSVSVVKDDKVIFCEGFGFRDVDQKLNMNEKTLLPIGSATKSFTASGVLMLQDEGLVDIDKPLHDYMPELVFQDHAANAEITARDLLCHRTGLPRHDYLWVLRPNIGRRELVESIRKLEPSAPFRSRWQYNNLMFASAGYLIEKLTGTRWEDWTRERIFEPLGMKRATFNCEDSVIDGNFALAYQRDSKTHDLNPVTYSRVTANGPAGSINASADELTRWLRFNLGKGTFGGDELLKAATFPQLTSPNIAYTLYPWEYPETLSMGYGLGWFVDCYRGKTLVWHGGNVNGSTAMVAFMPELNIGMTSQVNTGGSALPIATMYDAFDRLMGYADAKDWGEEIGKAMDAFRGKAEEERKNKADKRKPTRTAREFSDFEGTYRNDPYGTVKVQAKDDQQTIVLLEGRHEFENWHYDVFSAHIKLEMSETDVEVNFLTGQSGDIEALEIQVEGPPVKPIRFNKEAKQ